MVSLTGFSLVGGPAYNDAEAAEEILARLDVPYLVGDAGRVPDPAVLGRFGARPAAGGSHHDGGDPRTRRLHRPHGLRRPRRRRPRRLHRLRPGLHLRQLGERARHAGVQRTRRRPGRARRQAGGAAPHRAQRTQGRRGDVQLSAQRRQYRHRGLPVGVRVAAQHLDRDEGRRLYGGPAGQHRRAARTHHPRAMPSAMARRPTCTPASPPTTMCGANAG